jgi:hypothetical protein
MADVPVSVLEKIKKLFALSADPANAHEAALAAAKAQDILFKYHLTLKDIADADLRQRKNRIWEEDLHFERGLRDLPKWKKFMAAVVCRTNFCMLFTTPKGLRFIGTEEDILVASWLFGYLSATLERLEGPAWERRKSYMEHFEKGREELKKRRTEVLWKNNFKLGAIQVIEDRLKEQRKRQEAEAVREAHERHQKEEQKDRAAGMLYLDSMTMAGQYLAIVEQALAPIREAQQRVEDYADEHYSHAETGPDIQFTGDRDGLMAGMRAGMTIPLNKPLAAGPEEPVGTLPTPSRIVRYE